jgi:hypothetical protein
MWKNVFIFAFFCCLISIFQSCANWHTLKFETDGQPIQFGPHLLTSEVDTLGIVSGVSTHDFEKETHSESKHTRITVGGKDDIKENITTTIYTALGDDSQHFIADGQIVIEVEHGISFGAVFFGIIASMITDEETDFGTFSTESVSYNGIVYKKKNEKIK